MRLIVREKLVIAYLELVPMESGDDNSSEQDTVTATKYLEEPAAKQKRYLLWKKENLQRMKKAMERQRNPWVNGVCNAASLELGKDPVS